MGNENRMILFFVSFDFEINFKEWIYQLKIYYWLGQFYFL
jgi:hypothetical protein